MNRVFALLLLIILSPFLILIAIVLYLTGHKQVLFVQKRIGQFGKPFKLYKFQTMIPDKSINTTVTQKNDPRITRLGSFLRKYKIDELPELINIIKGDMNFVGYRPDVSGYYDRLKEEEKIILNFKPGITGPASLKYIDEEEILASKNDPEKYNNEVIFPDKIRINLEYLKRRSFVHDLKIILYTIFRKKWNEY